MEIEFTSTIFKEGRMFVAHAPQLDVSSCGSTQDKALANLKEAVRLFLEEAGKMGSLDQILEEAGYLKRSRGQLEGPRFIGIQRAPRPVVIPKYAAAPVFVIKNNLRTAGMSREQYLDLLQE